TTDAVYIDGHKTVEGDMTGPAAARMVLRDPTVDVAVLETARGGMLRRGIGYRRCNVGAVLNVAADHLGLRGVDTLEDLAKVKRVIAEVAKDTCVLNADDQLCLEMAAYTQADVVCYVTMDPNHALVKEHIKAGGRACVLEAGMGGHMITIYDKGAHVPVLWTHEAPCTLDGKALHNVQNAMFATAIAYSMGTNLDEVRHGLRTFDTTFFQAPGRMNICDDHPFRVILDYGHNPAAVEAMVSLTDRLEVDGRRILVIAAPGDRRDEDIANIAKACAGHYDHYICRRDDNTRGRDGDEVPRMQRQALLDAGVPDAQIELIPDEVAATARGLELAQVGDLLMVFGDNIERTWGQITSYHSTEEPAKELTPANKEEPAPTLVAQFKFDGDEELIRDARGVRLAKVVELED
ncbi:MAG: cyanophycin synthetase, partial [Planctomycetota bacterium]|nr:cyanophycin synthetase [Planctomycetota bacterium]